MKLRDLEAVVFRQAALEVLIDGDADADNEVIAGLAADLFEHHEAETQPVLQRTPEFIGAVVPGRRPELFGQVRLADHLAPVQAAFPAAPRGLAVRGDDTVDVGTVHDLGEAAVHLPRSRRRDARQPVERPRPGAPAEVGDLAHQGAVVSVYSLCKLPKVRNDRVVAQVEHTRRGRRVLRHGG